MEDYKELFDEIISLAWRNFIRKFRRGEIMASEKSLSEVMFQFCFANEIQSTGREYVGSDKVLEVNLETKWSNPKADTVQPKLIDITCHIIDDGEAEIYTIENIDENILELSFAWSDGEIDYYTYKRVN